MRTLQRLIEQSARVLAGSPTARLDAELLAAHALRLSREQLIVRGNEPVTPENAATLEALIERRRRGEPIAYITGSREFWSINLKVTPAVLIPRPETELLVEKALARIPSDTPARVADLGTGSGAIALALAQERPRASVVAIDASTKALAVASENAASQDIANIEFRLGDWTNPLAGDPFDVIVSNPPYVPSSDPHLNTGDARFEPRAALDGGPGGLHAIRRLAREAPEYLVANGWLLLEHGFDQKEGVLALLREGGFRDVCDYTDYGGNDRVVEGRKG